MTLSTHKPPQSRQATSEERAVLCSRCFAAVNKVNINRIGNVPFSYPSGERFSHYVASATSGILNYTYPNTETQLNTIKPSLCRLRRHRVENGMAMSGFPFHYVTFQTTHTPYSISERAPFAPLQSLTRYPIKNKNKKDCKRSPLAFPCQGLSALRVRSIKISTKSEYGSIFIGSALTRFCP